MFLFDISVESIMDALKSGAIFRLKNMAVVRSPPPIPSSKGADHSIAKTVQKDNSSVVENRAPDESAVIKRRFDEIYRSTPTPAAMLSRNYYWDQAPAQNTPTSSNSMQYAGTHYSGYRPVQSMLYCDSSSLQQSDAVSGSMNMPPPLLPATFTPSQFRSRSPALNTLQPLLEDSEPVKGEALRIMDSTPTSSTNTALADNIDYNESSTDLVDDDNDMQIAETNICDSRDHAKSRSVGTSSGGGGLSRSRGRLAGPNILMNLTSSKPTASSSSSSLLHGTTITVAARSPPSSSSMSSLQNEASPKFARLNKRTENSPEAKLSFMSNMSQTKRRRSPAGRLLADDSVYLLSEEPVFSSISEKGIADRQRYGSLTLVPMSSLLSGSAFNDYSSDDSSSNSSDSDNSRGEKSTVALKLPSRDTRLRIVKSNLTGGIGRLQKMSDIIAKSRSPAHREKLSSSSEKSEYDLSEYHFKASSSSCTDSTPHTERMGTEEKEVAADNESTDVSRILEEKRIESLVEDRIIIHTSAIDAFNTASSDSLNTSPLSHPILRSAIEPEGVLINTVLTSSGTGQAELKPKRTISRSRAAGIEESEVTGVTDNVAIKNGAETRRATRTSTVGADKNGQVVRSSVSIASTSSSSGVHSNSRFGSSSTNGSSSETVTQREWLAEERIALYAAQSAVDATASDFWQQVSSEMERNGIHRATEECQMKWFQTLDDTAKRRKNVLLAPTRRAKGMKSKNDDISVSIPTSAECKQVPEENVKKKRMMRADIKQLAEEASKAARADDIFEFQKDQGSRTFLTVGRRSQQDSTNSTTLSQSSTSAAINVPNFSPPKGFKVLDGLEDLEDLESPKGVSILNPHEVDGRAHKRTGLRNNNASYIHTLSKKMSAKGGKSSTAGASSSSIVNIKGQKGKVSANGVVGTFNPTSGKILIGVPRALKNSGIMEGEDEDDVAVDSDAYNQNLSEEEDGDF